MVARAGGPSLGGIKSARRHDVMSLGGRVFFQSVDPMKSRAKAPRRGWSEFVSELVSIAKQVHARAALWEGGGEVVEIVSKAIRQISGFGGKGFRMKEIRAASNMPVL